MLQPATLSHWPDLRDTVPLDLTQVNTAAMEEPARRLLNPDHLWMHLETGEKPLFPVEPTISPQMDHLDRRRTR